MSETCEHREAQYGCSGCVARRQAERALSLWKIATGASVPEHAQQALQNLRHDLEQAERERDEARNAVDELRKGRQEDGAHLYGHASLIGPCPHGRDPWTRCEDACSELNAVQVALLLRDAEKAARERAEAANAALVEALTSFRDSITFGDTWGAWFRSDCAESRKKWPGVKSARELKASLEVLNRPHPGAALLEERAKMRAHEAEMAESLRNALADLAKLEEYACNTCAPEEYATPEARKVAQALARLRALEDVRRALTPFWIMSEALVGMRADALGDAVVRRTPMGGDTYHVLTTEHCRALSDACAKADALRGGG